MPPKGSLLQAHIERLKLDDATYAAVVKALPRVRQILKEAKKRGLTRFVCGLGLGFSPLPLQIMLQNAEGNAYRPSISLQRVYRKPKAEEIGLVLLEDFSNEVLKAPRYDGEGHY
jgi:hypothetical protein